MLRILIFLIFVVLAATGITWLSGIDGLTEMQFGEWVLDVRTGLLLGLAAFFLVCFFIAGMVFFGLIRLPNSIRRRNADKRRDRGMVALSRGLEAVAAGDAEDAQRHARIAHKQLSEPSLTRLLTAQAAQLAGDEETAKASFSAMLEAPETEFLGLRGLYLQSLAAGHRDEARDYAERAFHLRPGADWAFNAVYGLNLDRGAWGDARNALQLAQQHKLEPSDAVKRKEAALLTAQAYAADNAEDSVTALRDAEAALKRAPAFTPAVVLAARLEAAAGRRSKAGRLLDDAWATAPHPAIARTMAELFDGESVERRAARLKKLASKAPEAEESKLLIAEQDIALGDYEAARQTLEPLLTGQPRARAFTAMAHAIEGLHGRDAAQYWFDRAAAAPLDPVPGADGAFNFTIDGWQRLIREFGDHNRLAPPPLEELRTGLSHDEIKLLTAPPPAPEPEPEPEIATIVEAPADDGVEDIEADPPVDETPAEVADPEPPAETPADAPPETAEADPTKTTSP